MTAQNEFDTKYITSTELCRRVGVTRATLRPAIERGDLPQPVEIERPNGGTSHMMLWLRSEAEPCMHAWCAKLNRQLAA